MIQVMDSTLTFDHAMRGSADLIDAFCQSTKSGNFFTIDSLTIRLWSLTKQIKAVHFVESECNPEVVGLEYVPLVDGFVALLQSIKSTKRAFSFVKVWDANLTQIYQFDLEKQRIIQFTFNLKQDAFLIIDETSYRGRLMDFSVMNRSMNKLEDKDLDLCCRVGLDSSFDTHPDFKVAQFIRDRCVIILTGETIQIFANNRGIKPGLKIPHGYPYKPEYKNITLSFKDMWDDSVPPTSMKIHDENKLVIAFRDGRIRVLLFFNGFSTDKRPVILFDFQINRDYKYSVTSFCICPWDINNEEFGIELMLFSSDNVLSHWRLQLQKDTTVDSKDVSDDLACDSSEKSEAESSEKATQLLGYSHLLGEYTITRGPTSKVHKRNSKKQHYSTKTDVISFELASFASSTMINTSSEDWAPRKKQVVATIDGQLIVLNVHEPHKSVFSSNMEILQAVSLSSSTSSMNKRIKGDIFSFASLHKDCIHLSHDLTVNNGIRTQAIIDAAYGYPTSLCFCEFSGSIFVGFSGGAVQRYSAVDSKKDPQSRIIPLKFDAATVHASSIKKMLTLSLRQLKTSLAQQLPPNELQVILVCDESGIMSLWHTSQNGNNRLEDHLSWAAQAHIGSIFHASSCCLDEFRGINILITACTSGLVKSWLVHSNGKLSLCTFFNASSCLTALSCVAILPNTIHDIAIGGLKSIQSRAKQTASSRNFSFMCLCGDARGTLESWMMSSDQQKAGRVPSHSTQLSQYPVLKMFRIGSFNEGVVSKVEVDNKSLKKKEDGAIHLMSLHSDGMFVVFTVDKSGHFQNMGASSFTVPFSPLNIIQVQGKCNDDQIFVIGSNEVIQLRKFDSYTNKNVDLSQSAVLSSPPLSGQNSVCDESNARLDLSQASESLSNATSFNAMIDDVLGEEGPFPEELSNSKLYKVDNASEPHEAVTRMSTPRVRLVEAISRDPRLLQLFQQTIPSKKNCISREDASRVIYRWLDIDASEEKVMTVIHDLLLMVYRRKDITFLQMSNIAAKVLSLFQKQTRVNRKKLEYPAIRSNAVPITYDAAGERVLGIPEALVQGDPHGKSQPFKNITYPMSPQSRSPATSTLSNIDAGKDTVKNGSNGPATLMKSFPESIKAVIRFNIIDLPLHWSIANKYWIDARRTVRICRTVLDMRGAKCLNDSLLSENGIAKFDESIIPTIVDKNSLLRLVIKYFERNFGAGSLNVSHQRVMHFLEALHQYSQHSIINAFRNFIFSDDNGSFSKLGHQRTVLTLYVIARGFLYSRGFVTPGELIPRTVNNDNDDLESGEHDDFKNASYLSSVPKRQLIPRVEALNCIHSVICLKGRYGPSVQEKIISAVNQMYSISLMQIPDQNSLLRGNTTDNMIDLEDFLEVLISEHSKALLMTDHLHDVVFKDSTDYNMDIEWPDLSLIGFSSVHANNHASSALQLRIFEMNELFHRFINTDDERTGLIDCTLFESIISCLIPNFRTSFAFKNLIRECKKSFCCDNGNRISYIDFWAIMLSYLVQKIGSCARIEDDALNSLPQMALSAVQEIKRGLEENQAEALVAYLGYVQCIVEDSAGNSKFDKGYGEVGEAAVDTMISKDSLQSIRGSQSTAVGSSLPLDGVWSMNAVQASDSPGLLSVVKIVGGNEQLKMSTSANMISNNNQSIPMVPSRSQASNLAIEKADLHPINLMWNYDASQLQSFLKPDLSTNKLPPLNGQSQSSSRSMSFKDTDSRHELPETAPSFRNENDVVDEYEEIFEAGSELNRVTCTEIERLRIAQLLRGHEMFEKLKIEKDLMQKRRAKKQASLHPYGKPVRKIPKRRPPLAGYESVPYSPRKIVKPVTPPLTPKEIGIQSNDVAIRLIKPSVEDLPGSGRLEEELVVVSPVEEIVLPIPISIQVVAPFELRRADSEPQKSPETRESNSGSASSREDEEEEVEETEVEEEERIVEQKVKAILPEPTYEIPVAVVSIPQVVVAPDYIIEQRKREGAEKFKMSLNDIRYQSFHIDIDRSKDSGDEEEEVDADEEDSEDKEFASSAAKKFFDLRKKLNDVARGHHSRRSDDFDGAAFFPMAFSNDLVFYPFNAQAQTDAKRSVAVMTSGEERNENLFGRSPRSAAADCSDIQQVVIDRKNQLEKDRLTQLYRTSLADVASENWTPMIRKEGVDWEAFMEQERVERLRPLTMEIQKKADEGDAIISKEFLLDRLKYAKEHALDEMSTIRLGNKEDGPASPTPIPLAFGKMHCGLCEINRPEYFYVQVTNPDSILTIELHCQQGFADLYSAFESLPTPLKFSNRATSTLENSRRARITLAVKNPGSVGILVNSSSTGASFSIWAYQSDDSTGSQSAIKHTTSLLKAFNILAETDEHDLAFHLPRLLAEAHKTVNLEESITPSALSYAIQSEDEYTAHASMTLDHSERLDSGSDDDATQSSKSEIDVIENVIFKKGKNIIKNAIRDGDIGDKDDPNVNSDLLLPWNGEAQAGVIWESEEAVHFPPIVIRKPRPEDMKKRVRKATNRPSLKSPTPITYTISKGN